MGANREWVEPVLLAAPAAAALLSSQDPLAAQVAFCVSAVGVASVELLRRTAPTVVAPGRSHPLLSAVLNGLWLPAPAVVVGLAALAAAERFSGDVASGFRTAGLATLAVALVLIALRPPAALPSGRQASLAGRRRSTQRGDALEGVTLVEVAEPVALLTARSEDLERDLRRLRRTGYGIVGEGPDGVRLVRLGDLDRPGVGQGRWVEYAKAVAVVDGGCPVASLDRLPEGDEVWLVSAGDLVMGAVTARARQRAEALARVRGRPAQPAARNGSPAVPAGSEIQKVTSERDGMPGERKGRA